MSDMWVDGSEDPRTADHPQGELTTYREYLTNYRLTLGMKCDGLDAEQMATRSVPPSTLSLLGLVRHMAAVENSWFVRCLQGHHDAPRVFHRDDDRDWDFNGAAGDPALVEEAMTTWKAKIVRADAWLDAVDEADLGVEVPLRGDVVAVRDVLVHMIEEYARHCGHADLLRERIDGRTGQ